MTCVFMREKGDLRRSTILAAFLLLLATFQVDIIYVGVGA